MYCSVQAEEVQEIIQLAQIINFQKNFLNTDKYWPHLNKFLFIEPENHQFRTGSSRQVAGRIKIHFWREG